MKSFVLALFAFLVPTVSSAQDLPVLVTTEMPQLLTIYKELHQHPELSHQEKQTSALLADDLRKAGFTVTENVGKYEDGTQAYGVVAVMKNGSGPTVLVRTDMDALPVEEKTGLPYASTVRSKNEVGDDVGVMHACGHDIHITTMIGVARAITHMKNQWHGTLILIGQPSEERVDGARAMLTDNLYTRFGKPDYALALHDDSSLQAGKVGVVSGPVLAGSASVDVIMRGLGGHGARPEATKDPVVMSAQFINAIQTIVSRQTPPQEPAVVTVGSIHGGTKRNIIPDQVTMLLTIRTFNDQLKSSIIAELTRTAQGVALAAGVPENRAPIVLNHENEGVSVTYNDPKLTAELTPVFVRALGAENVLQPKPEMGSEDFGLLGLENHQIPVFMLRVGAVAPETMAESQRTGKPLPSLHSSLFAPLPEPTIRTGIIAMTSAIVDLMSK
jgi:hippurate hydrolase